MGYESEKHRGIFDQPGFKTYTNMACYGTYSYVEKTICKFLNLPRLENIESIAIKSLKLAINKIMPKLQGFNDFSKENCKKLELYEWTLPNGFKVKLSGINKNEYKLKSENEVIECDTIKSMNEAPVSYKNLAINFIETIEGFITTEIISRLHLNFLPQEQRDELTEYFIINNISVIPHTQKHSQSLELKQLIKEWETTKVPSVKFLGHFNNDIWLPSELIFQLSESATMLEQFNNTYIPVNIDKFLIFPYMMLRFREIVYTIYSEIYSGQLHKILNGVLNKGLPVDEPNCETFKLLHNTFYSVE